jgi:hypothetical protein
VSLSVSRSDLCPRCAPVHAHILCERVQLTGLPDVLKDMPDPLHHCVDMGGNALRDEVCREDMMDMYVRPGHHDGADGDGPPEIQMVWPIATEAEKIIGMNKDPFDFDRKKRVAASPPPPPEFYFPTVDPDDPGASAAEASDHSDFESASHVEAPGSSCDSIADLDAWCVLTCVFVADVRVYVRDKNLSHRFQHLRLT